MTNKKIWYETIYSNFGQYFIIDEIVYQEKTKHHDLIFFKNKELGLVMALDGVVQTTELDEFIYHEMITHVPILAHGFTESVLIIGGGDGATLREVLSHKYINKIFMVEIDERIITLCKKYLPNHSAGSYNSPRVNLIIDDGLNFVNTTNDRFDIIISDTTDPIGPGKNLFSSKFYTGCKNILKNNGIFVAQNGVCFFQKNQLINSYQKLKKFFVDVSFYHSVIPTYYGGNMTFAWASNNSMLRKIDILTLQSRFKMANLKCRYYNTEIHQSSFALPQYLSISLLES